MTAKIRTIVNSYAASIGDPRTGVSETAWIIEYQEPGQSQRAVGFPISLLSWRAAEYGIDLSDTATLMDIAMYEHLMSVSPDDPTFLYNTDEATARSRHLARVSALKQQYEYHDPQSHLDRVKQHHLSYFSTDAHEQKRAHVQALRSHAMAARAGDQNIKPLS
jgi:hypothetical protein